MSQDPSNDPGDLHTLELLEELRAECHKLWGTSSDLYSHIDHLLRQLANPNLPDIPLNLPFRVELWDRTGQHIRWVNAACGSVSIGHGAFEAAIKIYPNYEWTLRNGMMVIREYKPEGR